MIRPYKYLDLKTCVLSVAAAIIAALTDSPSATLVELDEIVQVRLGEDARFNFIPALSFLYVTGSLQYDEQSDTVLLAKR